MTKDEALKLALEALEKDPAPLNAINNAKCFLYSALEQPEQVKRVCNTCNGTGMVKGLHNWATGGKREQPCWNCHEVANEEKEPTLCDVGSEGCLYVQENNTMKAIENRLCDLERRMAKLETLEQPEPAAWKHDCSALLTNDVELWIDRCPHCGKPRTAPPTQSEQAVSLEEYKRLQRLVTSQGIRLMEYESKQPVQAESITDAMMNVVDRLGSEYDQVDPRAWQHLLVYAPKTEPVQEPFCYHDGRNIVGKEYADHSDVFPLYTSPQPRQWRGLTDEEVGALTVFDGLHHVETPVLAEFTRAIEAKLKEKNS